MSRAGEETGQVARTRRRRWGAAVGIVAASLWAPPVHADGGDYKLDFTAAAPKTYDHSTGGGAYNDRTVGVNKDIVESLEGGDFKCGDTVTYLTEIDRDGNLGDAGPTETLLMQFSFLMDTTGQSGVAMFPVTFVGVNRGSVSNGAGAGGTDLGLVDDGGSVATQVSHVATGPIFTKGSELILQVEVDDLEPGEKVILRVDVFLDCDADNFRPTGNLQAQLNFTDVIASNSTTIGSLPDRVPGGEQTVPFKQVGRIVYVPPAANFANLPDSTSRIGAGVGAPGSQTTDANVGGNEASESASTDARAPGPISGFRSGSSTSSVSLPATGSSGTFGVMQIGVLLVSAGLIALVAGRRRWIYR